MELQKVERIDDLGFIAAFLNKSGLSGFIDKHYPVHGSWEGPSFGKLTLGWLLYMISSCDHRLCKVEDWAASRIDVLRVLLDAPDLSSKHFEDQRLEIMLDAYSGSGDWNSFMADYTHNLLRVYDLNGEVVRLDAMIGQSFRKVQGFFQMGYSKHHRSDLPQIKQMVAMLDPFALPVAMLLVSGDRADDQLYLPLIKEVQRSLASEGLLYVGDSKLSSLSNRAGIVQSNNGYLCPLSLAQLSVESRKELLKAAPTEPEMSRVYRDEQKAEELLAYGFEASRSQHYSYTEEKSLEWEETLFGVYSPAYGDKKRAAFEDRLEKGQAALKELLVKKQGRKQLTDFKQLEQGIQRIEKKYQIQGLIKTQIIEHKHTRKIRKHGNRPAREENFSTFEIEISLQHSAIKAQKALLGWQVYAHYSPSKQLDLKQAILMYRKQYRIEHKFDQLINRNLNMIPFFLKIQKRITALIQLLQLALQFVTLIEQTLRSSIAQQENPEALTNLYPGNPGRKTLSPTTYLILNAFANISLAFFKAQDGQTYVQMTPLSPIQKKLIQLAQFQLHIYTKIPQFFKTALNLAET